MTKMTKEEKAKVLEMLDERMPYDVGECDINDNYAYIELYGKAYGRGTEGSSDYSIKNGNIHLETIYGDDLRKYAELVYDKVLRFFPKIKKFSVMVQTD